MIRGAASEPRPAILELIDASKSFGGTSALRGVSFSVQPGAIHALVGENGAGKSTLVNILSGVLGPDEGELWLHGHPVHFAAPLDANTRGIHLVHQELALLPESSVVENVFLGSEMSRFGGMLDRPAMRQETETTLARLGVRLDPRARIRDLSVAHRQMVEIARSLVGQAEVIILDEPTAALTPDEAKSLFAVLRQLRSEGRGIVYISHRIEEVLALADTVTVLKDGQLVGTWPSSDLTLPELIRKMVGRPIEDLFPPTQRDGHGDGALLEAVGVIDPPSVAGVDLSLRPGEIVGIAGLEGHGQDQLLGCLAGERQPVRGQLRVLGKDVSWGGVRAMLSRGVGFVPEDRKTQGLLLELSTVRNVSLPALADLSHFGWVDGPGEASYAEAAVRSVGVRGNTASAVQSLSGGNQQKVVLAKWLARRMRVLILNQPTRGVDVGAKGEIYALLRAFAEEGGAVLLASRELAEILGLCDRVLVMRDGRVVAEFGRGASEEQVMAAAVSRGTAA